MDEVAKSVFTAPIATLFIIAGIIFLFVAVVGNISGKIEPGEKARIVSGVVGVAFIALGLAMHLLQKTPGVSESPSISSQSKSDSLEFPPQKPTPSIQISNQAPVLDNPPSQKQEILNSPLQTRFSGVVAHIVHFEKRGELVMLHLMARNLSGRTRHVCFSSMQTTLIHESTGESWKP